MSTGAHQVDVFFVDGYGRLARAAQDQRGWQVSELPGNPARGSGLDATSYLLGKPSTAAGPARLGTAVYYLTRSGQPAVTYAAGGQPWRTATLPGPAASILGADSYQAAGQPSRVFLADRSGSRPFSLDEARGPGGPRAAPALTPSSTRLPPAALWLAASGLVALCLAVLCRVRRRLTGRTQAPGP